MLLLFILLGTGYGVGLFALPFYETMRDQMQDKGIRYFYKNKTGLLDLPMPWVLVKQAFTTGMDEDVVLRLVFPLLLGIFSIMVGFFGTHLYYIMTARTTLEYKIMLEVMKEELVKEAKDPIRKKRNVKRASNPFNQGWRANLHQVLGPNLLLIFLPIPVTPPRPYVPGQKDV